MELRKEDLLEANYSWNDNGFKGQPSRRLFDRYNGYQVLFIINSIGAESDNFDLETAKILEAQIANQLPVETKSEISVFNWLKLQAVDYIK